MINFNFRRKHSETARELSKDFPWFRKYYFQNHHKFPDAAFHKEICELLSKMSRRRGSRLALAAPRGMGKSTLITLEYALYNICHLKESFIVLISGTASQAEDFLSNIKTELQQNEKLLADFPELCNTGHKPAVKWKQDEIITLNGVKVLVLSPSQSIRGRKHGVSRPSLIILDDIEPDTQDPTSEQFDKLQEWFTSSVLKAGSENPESNIIFTGTIHRYGSFLERYINPKMNPGWIKKLYRAVISWAKRSDLWGQWERIYNSQEMDEEKQGPDAALRFFHKHEKEMLKGAKVIWPEWKSYYDLMVVRENEGHYSFDSELQNEPVNPKDCIFGEIHYWEDQFPGEAELLGAIANHCTFLGACDPSLGKEKGDYSAILTAVRDDNSGTIYMLDADIERRHPDKIIDDILNYYQKRSILAFGFETNQFQNILCDQLQQKGNERNIYPTVVPLQNYSDKLLRIQSLQPLIKNGTVQFSKKQHLLLEQIRRFPKCTHDDGPDALAMLIEVGREYVGRQGISYPQAFPSNRSYDLVGYRGDPPESGVINYPRVYGPIEDRFVPPETSNATREWVKCTIIPKRQ